MKHLKRFAALLMTFVMVLSLSTTAFAAGSNSITVQNAVEGQEYKLYKMLDLVVSADKTAYSYTVNSAWTDFFKAASDGEAAGTGRQYVEIDAQGYVTWKDTADVAAFAQAAEQFAKDKSLSALQTKTAGKETLTFEGLDAGYYLITSTLGTKATVGTTPGDPNPVIAEKNAAPSVDKQVQEDSNNQWGKTDDADIGQTVNFKATITAQPGAENYVFYDKMSAGLTYSKDAKIYTNADMTQKLTAENYTVDNTAADDYTFKITFTQTYLDTITTETKLYVKYSATLNENAVVGLPGNPNNNWLSYGDNSHTSTNTTPKNETITYTWDVNIFKYAKDGGTEKALAGAVFTLSKNSNGSDPIKLVNEGSNVYRIAADTEINTAITEITTDSTGKFTIKGLDSDTYYLTEITAPDGYNKLSAPIKIKIDNQGQVFMDPSTTALADKTVKIQNQSGTELPSTGGMGTTIFYAAGSILVLAAVVLLVTRKRMDAKN